MSTGFDILISPPAFSRAQPIKFYERILRLVLESSNVSRRGIKLVIYREQRPFNYGVGSKDPHVIVDRSFDEEKSVSELVEIIDGVKLQNVYVGVSCGYERLRWSNEKCDTEPSVGWLVVEYESPKFESGYNSRMRGCHRIHFDNRDYFGHRMIDLSKCPASHPEALSKLVRYGSNLNLVKNLSKEIVTTLSPAHLILITEGTRVNPADFHSVYHKQISSYLVDAKKMLQLHHYGGGYFYDGCAGDFDPSYRSLSSEGPLYVNDGRSAAEAQKLASTLDLYSTLLAGNIPNGLGLSDEEIFEIVTSSEGVESEIIGDGLYTVSSRGLNGYLNVIFERLLDRLGSKSLGNR